MVASPGRWPSLQLFTRRWFVWLVMPSSSCLPLRERIWCNRALTDYEGITENLVVAYIFSTHFWTCMSWSGRHALCSAFAMRTCPGFPMVDLLRCLMATRNTLAHLILSRLSEVYSVFGGSTCF